MILLQLQVHNEIIYRHYKGRVWGSLWHLAMLSCLVCVASYYYGFAFLIICLPFYQDLRLSNQMMRCAQLLRQGRRVLALHRASQNLRIPLRSTWMVTIFPSLFWYFTFRWTVEATPSSVARVGRSNTHLQADEPGTTRNRTSTVRFPVPSPKVMPKVTHSHGCRFVLLSPIVSNLKQYLRFFLFNPRQAFSSTGCLWNFLQLSDILPQGVH